MPPFAARLPFLLSVAGMARAETASDRPPGSRSSEGSAISVRPYVVTVAIWSLIGSVFVLDLLTPADDVSVCFAYLIPIFASLFEARPRPILYASASTAFSVLGMIIQPPQISTVMMVLIAVLTQWVVATLVKLQQRRLIEANEKAESQRRFVDILSHEVGTALTTVTGQAYRLTKLSEQLAPDDVRLRAEKIRKAAERIEAIISRIQFASSLGDGSIPTGESPINLHAMIPQLADQMKDEGRTGPIELHLCPEPKFVAGDEMLLRQLFENVIANSIKYSPPDTPITVDIAEHGPAVRVTIADRGSGIAEGELPRIRAAYYRGPNSKGISGAGLGLFVVEKLVEAHHGHLSIESEIGSGTRVIIDLPQIAPMAAA